MLKMIVQASAIVGLAFGGSMIAPPEAAKAASFAKNCGGLGQKTCISISASNRCNAGLVERKQSGRNICVKPNADRSNLKDCGGLGQKSCISLSASKRCNAGLEERRQSGRNICVKPNEDRSNLRDCGGLGQKSCINVVAWKRCNAGLEERRQSGRNICVKPNEDRSNLRDCGGLGQKSCINVVASKRCNAGLEERRQSGRNICVKPNEDRSNLRDCGALGQKSCVNVIASKRCNAGLVEFRQRGRNICIRDGMGVDTTQGCGGIGEKSCWSGRPSQWCDAGLIYKPGGIPGRGRCVAADEDNMIQRTRAATSRMKSLGADNELRRLRNCLVNPVRLSRLKREMKEGDSNGTNAIIRECNVDLAKLKEEAAYILGERGASAARGSGAYTAASASAPGAMGTFTAASGQSAGRAFVDNLRVTIELSADASFFSSSVSGVIGYAIPLSERPLGSRWYKGSDEYLGGIDVGIGGDLLIGVGAPGVPDGDGAIEVGNSGVVAGALGLKIAATIRMDKEGGTMFALFGGVGLGATVAIYEYQNEFFKDR